MGWVLWSAIKKAVWALFCIWLVYWFYIYYVAAPDRKGRAAVLMCFGWSTYMALFTHLRRQKRRQT